MNKLASENGFTKEVLKVLKDIINKDFDRFYGLQPNELEYDDYEHDDYEYAGYKYNEKDPNIFEKSMTGSGLDLSQLECWELKEYIVERVNNRKIEKAYWHMYDADNKADAEGVSNPYSSEVANREFENFNYILTNSPDNKMKYFIIRRIGEIDYILFIE